MPLLMSPSSRTVIWLASGSVGNHRWIVWSRLSLPRSASSRINVPSVVFVTDPIRVCSRSTGRGPEARFDAPRTAVPPRLPTHTPAIPPGAQVHHPCRRDHDRRRDGCSRGGAGWWTRGRRQFQRVTTILPWAWRGGGGGAGAPACP